MLEERGRDGGMGRHTQLCLSRLKVFENFAPSHCVVCTWPHLLHEHTHSDLLSGCACRSLNSQQTWCWILNKTKGSCISRVKLGRIYQTMVCPHVCLAGIHLK